METGKKTYQGFRQVLQKAFFPQFAVLIFKISIHLKHLFHDGSFSLMKIFIICQCVFCLTFVVSSTWCYSIYIF